MMDMKALKMTCWKSLFWGPFWGP